MAESALDHSTFSEMRELMGDALVEFIHTYLENSPQLIHKIETGLAQDNPETIFHSAHQLKGGSGSIGAMKLSNISLEIEKIGRSGSTQGVASLLNQLKSEYALLETELKSYI